MQRTTEADDVPVLFVPILAIAVTDPAGIALAIAAAVFGAVGTAV